MELYLLRHALPVDPSQWSGADRDRPLTAVGQVQAREVLRALKSSGRLAPQAIWASPYLRTTETARIASSILGVDFETIPALASGSDLLRSLLEDRGDLASWPQKLLLVGHQPDLSLLVEDLTAPGHYPFSRAGSARLDGLFRTGGMTLKWLLTADAAITHA